MLLLIAFATLWLLITYAVLRGSRPISALRIGIGAVLIAYGIAVVISLGGSYRAGSRGLAEADLLVTQSELRMERCLETAPDTVRTSEVVSAAFKLLDNVKTAIGAAGAGGWDVRWRYGVLPAFDASEVNEKLLRLAGMPALMTYAKTRDVETTDRVRACEKRLLPYVTVSGSRPFGYAMRIYREFDYAQGGIAMFAPQIDPIADSVTDPRSPSYRVEMLTMRMLGTLAKINAIYDVSCDGFDQLMSLRIVHVYEDTTAESGKWYPVSTLFGDVEQLTAFGTGINQLEARWMGSPERPVLGSIDANYRIDVTSEGPWPSGQDTWTGEDGTGGQTYFVGPYPAELYPVGMEIVKWPAYSEWKSTEMTGSAVAKRMNGMPVAEVNPNKLYPPENWNNQ